MVVNLTPLRYTLTLGGTDYTEAWSEGQFSTTPFDEGSGLLLLSGQLTLSKHDLDLDPRTNRDLFPGTAVVITRNPGSPELIPIFGTTYITNAEEDRQSDRTTVSIGCWLSLLNVASRAEIGVCIENQEEGITMQSGIETLLLAAGIPLANIDVSNITGTLLETKTIDESTSFVQLAGELAYSQGFTLYQGIDGVVRAQVTNDRENKASTLAVTEAELAQYNQKPDKTGVPPGKVRVTGNRLWPVKPRTDLSRDSFTTTEFGTLEEYFGRTYDSDNRIANQIEQTVGPLGTVTNEFGNENLRLTLENKQTEETYEKKPIPWDCVTPDEGRMTKRIIKTTAPQVVRLLDFLLIKAEYDGDDPREIATPIGSINSELIEEFWEYNSPTNAPICGTLLLDEFGDILAAEGLPENTITSGQYFIKKTLRKLEPTAAIFPNIGDPFLGRDTTLGNTGELSVNRFFLRESEREETLWTLNPDGETWLKVSKFYQVKWRAFPQSVQAQINLLAASGNLYAYTTLDCFQSATRLVPIRTEVDRNTSPQEPGRFPSSTRYGRTPYKIDASLAGVPNTLANRLKTFSLPDETPLGDVQSNAETILLREWGRGNAQLINLPDDLVPNTFIPLDVIQVTEDDGDIYRYEADSLSLAIEPRQAYYASIGLLIGRDVNGTTEDIWSRGLTYNTGMSYSDTFQCSEIVDTVNIEDGSFLTYRDDDLINPDAEFGVYRSFLDGILAADGLLFLYNTGP